MKGLPLKEAATASCQWPQWWVECIMTHSHLPQACWCLQWVSLYLQVNRDPWEQDFWHQLPWECRGERPTPHFPCGIFGAIMFMAQVPSGRGGGPVAEVTLFWVGNHLPPPHTPAHPYIWPIPSSISLVLYKICMDRQPFFHASVGLMQEQQLWIFL